MKNLESIVKELRRLSEIKGDNFSASVKINARLSATLGRVVFTRECEVKAIEFSQKFLETGTEEEILAVVAHEWCHYYLLKVTKKDHNHNAVFNALAKEMGGAERRTMVVKTMSLRYTVVCGGCGEVVANYQKAGNVVKSPEQYKSKCCGAKLLVNKA